MPRKAVVVSATTAERPQELYAGEAKGFVEDMRFVAMKLHTTEQAKEGEKQVKEPEEQSVAKWEPTIDGYLRFLVDSKLGYDTLENIIQDVAFPSYAEFINTGLERSASLAKDLEWFREGVIAFLHLPLLVLPLHNILRSYQRRIPRPLFATFTTSILPIQLVVGW